MTTTIRSSADGSKSYIQVGGTDRITIDAATGKLTSTYSPPTGERSLALATMQKFADEFGASLATSGYQKLPNGLIIQWGSVAGASVAVGASRSDVFTFPVAFPSAVLLVSGGAQCGGGMFVRGWVRSSFTTTTACAVSVENDSGSGQGAQVIGSYYIAIGY